ncbi:EF-Tu/IF-2/RF-3 family GTPase [Streptomyces rubiginosohelvolus]|uniref:EF-Tu C-terminal domain-related protein n=1 Tax=Streptomyces rubiginosohelvolus TaxID=67362 RepID=UPI00341EA56F
MPIEDAGYVSGRGTCVTGQIERGTVRIGDVVEVVGWETTECSCIGVEMFRKPLDEGRAGDTCAVFLDGIKPEDVPRGHVLVKPGTVKPHTKFTAEVTLLSTDQGGRAVANGRRLQFTLRVTDVTGDVHFPEDVASVGPGGSTTMEVTLVRAAPLEDGLHFAVREDGQDIGTGAVSQIIQ